MRCRDRVGAAAGPSVPDDGPGCATTGVDGRPGRFVIDPDDFSAKDVGQTTDGRQFFLTAPFELDASDYVALYIFDAYGQFIVARIDDLGPRPSNQDALWQQYDQRRGQDRPGAADPLAARDFSLLRPLWGRCHLGAAREHRDPVPSIKGNRSLVSNSQLASHTWTERRASCAADQRQDKVSTPSRSGFSTCCRPGGTCMSSIASPSYAVLARGPAMIDFLGRCSPCAAPAMTG